MTRRRKTLRAVPEVTVITPTFNRAGLVCGAIESVLKQTFKKFEYFIVDDGSTDDTKKKIAPYLKDPRLFYFYQTNAGQASALNLGMRFARSPWVAFLDSDDEYHADHLKYLMSKAKTDKNLDLVIGSFEPIGVDPNRVQVVDYYRPTKLIELNRVEVVSGTLLLKKEVAMQLGGFRGVLSDIDLVERMKNAGSKWKKVRKQTLKYYFGRTADSISLREVDRRRNSIKKRIA